MLVGFYGRRNPAVVQDRLSWPVEAEEGDVALALWGRKPVAVLDGARRWSVGLKVEVEGLVGVGTVPTILDSRADFASIRGRSRPPKGGRH